MPTTSPPPTSDHIEAALEALRREWRSGFNGRMVRTLALPSVQRLKAIVPTHQAGMALQSIEERMLTYQSLPPERRKEELKQIADSIKSIEPHVRLSAAPARPVGKLNEAVAPGRGTTAEVSRERPAVVRAIKPDAPITALPRVGEAVAKKLKNLGVETLGDLLRLSPRRYIDYSRTVKIGSILGFGMNEEITVRGEVTEIREIHGPGRPRVTIRLADETGWVRVTWFNAFVARQLAVGSEIAVSGVLDLGYGPPTFTSPEWERMGGPSLSTGRLTPVYPLTAGVAQKTVRSLTRACLDATRSTLTDFLPTALRDEHSLPALGVAYEQLHYPQTYADLEGAQRRLAFDSLLLLQIGLVRRKRERQVSTGIVMKPHPDLTSAFHAGLPFRLTEAQLHALDEVTSDLERSQPMARLLQGDVGSGKTVVAATAALIAVANEYQAAVMAPTEILAEQHFHNFRGLYASLPLEQRPTVGLLTGSTRAAERRPLLEGLTTGSIDVLIGTHALIQEPVSFAALGFVVIDEQHRFGVRQRGTLSGKAMGAKPHVLAMTATPIPRTLNLVLNGDVDVSIIGELPPGRIPVETHRFVGNERALAYDLVRAEVDRGHQAFVICPLVEESDASDAKAAVAEAARLQSDVFPDLRIATLHGRMAGRDKDRIMTAFRDGAFDILVSTSVIEVGIDVPNATAMLVEGADRFGLAQLHQFRGRVGRGGEKSYCLLLAEESSPDGEARLELMVETNDGFLLAEKDLELRGPGDFIGTRQSGLPEMSWIDGSFDTRLLDQARRSAEELLIRDPELASPELAPLAARLAEFWSTAATESPLS